ncbi:DUF4936 family protein [Massilia glaciei]|uniref:DUF4936 domain-containing protein n=1 Tax=Massilia glaciei TaxID=1524097 RepID=A0A2U2HG86_9BURK|nr:DUF4936 family protein [Massilia glaciei]PWF43941.1 DUF4936 domain-containing protein [Massilia glaciei]
MFDLYIYYQVRAADADALAPRVRAMQDRLAADHGVAGQLKRRPGAKDSRQTWMEIYPATAAGFDAALAAAVQDAALSELTDGHRHIEVFTDITDITDITPCA